MEAHKKRNIQSGERYTHLFPKANNATDTIRKDANVYHTVEFIPKVVHSTLGHTQKAAQLLQGASVYDTCSNVWQFVYDHIAYKKDKDGYEQIRSPARAWMDRFSGVDCDCYSVFISSILTNLKIPHLLRITKYQRDYFQHIYPIVPTGKSHITIDCVTEKFNYEVPYSEKKDYPMDLQYLNGFDNTDTHLTGAEDGMAALGKIFSKRFGMNAGKAFKAAPNNRMPKVSGKQRRKARRDNVDAEGKPRGFKKLLNKFNKLNPITVALRNGVLASMKLNIKNVAGRLRWSYITPQEAQQKGIALARYQQLVNTRKKLENIFYKAGGKPENLRKAILKGKANRDKAVKGLNGFDGFDGNDNTVMYMNEYTPLPQLLGGIIYHSENIEGMEGLAGLGALGEPLTLASIAAASKVISAIAAKLKNIGNIFQNKSKQSEDFDEERNEQAERTPLPQPDKPAPELPEATQPPTAYKEAGEEENYKPSGNNQLPYNHTPNRPNSLPNTPSSYPSPSPANRDNEPAIAEQQSPENAAPAAKEKAADDTKSEDDKPTGFWDKNKQWLKPVAIGVGGIGLIALGASLLKSNAQKPAAKPAAKSINGIPKKVKRGHRRKANKATTKHKHLTPKVLY